MITYSTFPEIFVGDMPAEKAVVELDDDLTQYPNVEVMIRSPWSSGSAPLTGITTVAGGAIEVALNGLTFNGPGQWSLQLVLSGPGVKQSLTPVPFIVQEAADGWLTLGQIRSEWRDAPDSDAALYRVLEVTKDQILAFAGDPEFSVPANYVQAQRMQARNIWNAAKTDPSGNLGDGQYAVRPYPMDKFIRQILRPMSGAVVVGRA